MWSLIPWFLCVQGQLGSRQFQCYHQFLVGPFCCLHLVCQVHLEVPGFRGEEVRETKVFNMIVSKGEGEGRGGHEICSPKQFWQFEKVWMKLVIEVSEGKLTWARAWELMTFEAWIIRVLTVSHSEKFSHPLTLTVTCNLSLLPWFEEERRGEKGLVFGGHFPVHYKTLVMYRKCRGDLQEENK